MQNAAFLLYASYMPIASNFLKYGRKAAILYPVEKAMQHRSMTNAKLHYS